MRRGWASSRITTPFARSPNPAHRAGTDCALDRTGANVMLNATLSRRDVLKASTALAAGAVFAQPLGAAAPAPSAVTPALIEAARKEGKLSFYSALELPVAERFGKLFEAKYPGITVRVERSGAERLFQRIRQEQASPI